MQKVSAESLRLLNKSPIPRFVNVQARLYVDPAIHVKRIRVVLVDVTTLKTATDDVVEAISHFGDLK